MRLVRTVAALALLALASGCAQYEEPAPLVGWTCMPTFGGCDMYGTPASTLNVVVGLPVEWLVVANCNTGHWRLQSAEVQTGRLPPGLELDTYSYKIVGVPTRAGSFSFQVLFRGIECPGSNYLPYGDYTANFTIIATGS